MYKAYAKINIGLSILYKRYDGYHELETIMASVSLYDELFFNINDSGKISVETSKFIVKQENNLVYLIAKELKEQFKIKQGVEIKINKQIPIAGGMAGGSSNAATTIKALNELWNINMTLDEMMKFGAKFGADIPFCINQKPAVVTGIGEKVEPFTFNSDFNIIVVPMPFGLSTKKVFKNFDVANSPIYSISKIKSALETNNRQLLLDNLGNNLENVSLFLKPEIAQVKNKLVELGCFTSLMSGSGPTVLGFIDKNDDHTPIINELKNLGYNAFLTNIIN